MPICSIIFCSLTCHHSFVSKWFDLSGLASNSAITLRPKVQEFLLCLALWNSRSYGSVSRGSARNNPQSKRATLEKTCIFCRCLDGLRPRFRLGFCCHFHIHAGVEEETTKALHQKLGWSHTVQARCSRIAGMGHPFTLASVWVKVTIDWLLPQLSCWLDMISRKQVLKAFEHMDVARKGLHVLRVARHTLGGWWWTTLYPMPSWEAKRKHVQISWGICSLMFFTCRGAASNRNWLPSKRFLIEMQPSRSWTVSVTPRSLPFKLHSRRGRWIQQIRPCTHSN